MSELTVSCIQKGQNHDVTSRTGVDIYVVNVLWNTASRVMECSGFQECERLNLRHRKNKIVMVTSSAGCRFHLAQRCDCTQDWDMKYRNY